MISLITNHIAKTHAAFAFRGDTSHCEHSSLRAERSNLNSISNPLAQDTFTRSTAAQKQAQPSFLGYCSAQKDRTSLHSSSRKDFASHPFSPDGFRRAQPQAKPAFGTALKVSDEHYKLLDKLDAIQEQIDKKLESAPEALGLDFDTEAVKAHGKEIAGHYADLAKTYLAFDKDNGLCRQNAFDAAQDAIEAHPEHPEANYLMAQLEAEPEEALGYIKTSIKHDPKNRSYLLLGAEIAEELENEGLAFKYMNRAVELDPKNLDTRMRRGFLNNNFALPDKANEDFDAAIQIAPYRYDGYAGKAEVLMDKGDNEGAITYYKKALETNPPREEIGKLYSNLGLNYYQSKNYPEAISAYSRSLEAEPDADLFLDRGFCHYFIGQNQEAQKDAQMALKSGYEGPAPIALHIVSLEAEGKADEAAKYLERAEDSYPEHDFHGEMESLKNLKKAYEEKLKGAQK